MDRVIVKHQWLVGGCVQLADGTRGGNDAVLPQSCWKRTRKGLVLRAPPPGPWLGALGRVQQEALAVRPFTVQVFFAENRLLLTSLKAGDVIPPDLLAGGPSLPAESEGSGPPLPEDVFLLVDDRGDVLENEPYGSADAARDAVEADNIEEHRGPIRIFRFAAAEEV